MARVINVTNGNYTHQLYIDVISQSIANNTSTVQYLYRIVRNTSAQWGAWGTSNFRTTINGENITESEAFDFRNYSSHDFMGGTRVINHNSDGSKTISVGIRGPMTFISSGFPETSRSTNYTLPTIPRASNPTFEVSGSPVSSIDAGDQVTIDMNRADSGFTHSVYYSFGSQDDVLIANGVGASVNWTPPLSLLEEIPNSTSGTAEIRVVTRDGGSTIGSRTKNLTIKVPSEIGPDFDTITHSEATIDPDIAAIVGAYVRGFSSLDVAITGATGAYGSTIQSYKITIAGQSVNAQSGTTGVINVSGNLNLQGTIIDSRNRQAQKAVVVPILSYSVPTIDQADANRSTSGGTLDPSGTYIKVDIEAAVQSLIVGTQKNDLTWRIRIRERGDTTPWDQIVPVAGATEGSTGYIGDSIIGPYSAALSYEVRVEVEDVLGSVSALENVVSTAGVQVHFSKDVDGVGVGKYHEQGSVDALEQMYQNDGLEVLDESRIATYVDALLNGTPDQLAPTDATTYLHDAISDLSATTVHEGDDPVSESTPPANFHWGVTIGNAGPGFPVGLGTVMTVKHLDTRAFQMVVEKESAELWMRGTVSDGSAWNSWYQVARHGQAGMPRAMASGTLGSVSVSAGATRNDTVTLPSGLFSGTPQVVTNIDGDARDVTSQVDNRSSSSFILRRGSNSTVTRSVAATWIAVQS